MTADPRVCAHRIPSRHQLLQILDLSPMTIYCCGSGPDYPTTFISSNVAMQFGYQPGRFYDDPLFWTKQIHPEDAGGVLAMLDRVMEGESVQYEYRLRCSDGRYLWLHDEVRPLVSADKAVTGCVGSWIDISSRKRGQADIERTVAEFQLLLGSISDCLWSAEIDRSGRFSYRYYSPVVERITGRPPEFYLPSPDRWLSTVHPDDVPRLRTAMERIQSGRSDREEEEYRIIRPDGSVRHVRDRATAHRADGITRLNGVVTDVTARKHLEEELNNIYKTAPVGLCLLDTELRFVRVNERLAAINGRPMEEHIGRSIREVIPEISRIIEPLYRKVLRTGEPLLNQEVRGVTPAEPGVEKSWMASYAPVKLDDGTVVGLNTVVTDITEQKRALDDLRIYQHLVSATPDNVSFVDTDYVYRAVSDSYAVAHGLPRSDIVDHPVAELLGDDTFERIVKPNIDRCLAGERVRYQDWFEFSALGKRCMDVVYNRFVDSNRVVGGVVVSARDITEQKNAEEALKESQVRLERITATIPDVVWIHDWESRDILYASPGYERIWGRPTEELYADREAWTRAIHDDDRARVRKAFSGLVEDSNEFDQEYRVVRPEGSIRWIRDREYPIRGEDGRIIQVAGIAHDITEQKEAAETRRQLEAQLRHAQKMQAVGQLAAGIAHDVNSLLMVILGNTQLAQSKLERHGQDGIGQSTEALRQVCEQVELGKSLIQKFMTVGRARSWNPRAYDLNRIIDDHRRLMIGYLGDTIHVEFRCPRDLRKCQVDPGLIEQVLLNLILNARDAMGDAGRLKIETANVAFGKRHVKALGGMPANAHVMLAVSDTGSGMEPDTLDRMFEPFFTTKPVNKGSGLGLAIVHGIVEQASGHIVVESEPNHGTTFKLYFPAVP